MERVNAMILSRTGSEVTMIPEVANHLISSGGKRLRPMLTLATAVSPATRATGHVKLAASVEFMHTATLLHDDVVDESDMRRGKVAARIKWGNEASVLVGDFLLGQAFKMMVEVGSLRALDILSAAATVIAEGEVMQLAAAKNTETTEDEYLAVIRGKTAELFAAACEVGPVIAERPKAEQAACRSYGMNLGIAFQLVDDALDYGGTSATLGKNVGDDFREGKITLPVVLSFRRGSAQERAFWKRVLEQGDIEDGDLERSYRDHAPPPRARRHGRARAPLRRHGSRRARPLPRRPDETGASRSGRVLHRAGVLSIAALFFLQNETVDIKSCRGKTNPVLRRHSPPRDRGDLRRAACPASSKAKAPRANPPRGSRGSMAMTRLFMPSHQHFPAERCRRIAA